MNESFCATSFKNHAETFQVLATPIDNCLLLVFKMEKIYCFVSEENEIEAVKEKKSFVGSHNDYQKNIAKSVLLNLMRL